MGLHLIVKQQSNIISVTKGQKSRFCENVATALSIYNLFNPKGKKIQIKLYICNVSSNFLTDQMIIFGKVHTILLYINKAGISCFLYQNYILWPSMNPTHIHFLIK